MTQTYGSISVTPPENDADFSVADVTGITNTVLTWFNSALQLVSPITPHLYQFTQNDHDGTAYALGAETDLGIADRIKFIRSILSLLPSGVSSTVQSKIKHYLNVIAPNLSAGAAVGWDGDHNLLQSTISATLSVPDWVADKFKSFQSGLTSFLDSAPQFTLPEGTVRITNSVNLNEPSSLPDQKITAGAEVKFQYGGTLVSGYLNFVQESTTRVYDFGGGPREYTFTSTYMETGIDPGILGDLGYHLVDGHTSKSWVVKDAETGDRVEASVSADGKSLVIDGFTVFQEDGPFTE
jgi:hypothetical protein